MLIPRPCTRPVILESLSKMYLKQQNYFKSLQVILMGRRIEDHLSTVTFPFYKWGNEGANLEKQKRRVWVNGVRGHLTELWSEQLRSSFTPSVWLHRKGSHCWGSLTSSGYCTCACLWIPSFTWSAAEGVETSCAHCAVLRPATWVSFRNLLGMQILRLHSRPPESAPVGAGPRSLGLNKPNACLLKSGKHRFRQSLFNSGSLEAGSRVGANDSRRFMGTLAPGIDDDGWQDFLCRKQRPQGKTCLQSGF